MVSEDLELHHYVILGVTLDERRDMSCNLIGAVQYYPTPPFHASSRSYLPQHAPIQSLQ